MAGTATATETERELDRVWKAIDDATGRISDLERALERGRGLQHAPSPDYGLNEVGPPPEQPRCPSCDQVMGFFAGPRAGQGGYTCLVCDDQEPEPEPAAEPVEVCSCEEAIGLRRQVGRLTTLLREIQYEASRAFIELSPATERAIINEIGPHPRDGGAEATP